MLYPPTILLITTSGQQNSQLQLSIKEGTNLLPFLIVFFFQEKQNNLAVHLFDAIHIP